MAKTEIEIGLVYTDLFDGQKYQVVGGKGAYHTGEYVAESVREQRSPIRMIAENGTQTVQWEFKKQLISISEDFILECLSHPNTASKPYLIWSDKEDGWWNNCSGWVEFMVDATHFTPAESEQLHLPVGDGRWIDIREPA